MFDRIIANARKLNLPRFNIGINWVDIYDIEQRLLIYNLNDKQLSDRLDDEIIKLQNSYAEEMLLSKKCYDSKNEISNKINSNHNELDNLNDKKSSFNDELLDINDMIDNYEEQIKTREDAVKTREDALKSKEDNLKSKEDALKSREDEVKSREDEVKTREDKVKTREHEVKTREDTLKSKEDAIKNREQQIKSREDAVKTREDAELERKELEMKELERKQLERKQLERKELERKELEMKELEKKERKKQKRERQKINKKNKNINKEENLDNIIKEVESEINNKSRKELQIQNDNNNKRLKKKLEKKNRGEMDIIENTHRTVNEKNNEKVTQEYHYHLKEQVISIEHYDDGFKNALFNLIIKNKEKIEKIRIISKCEKLYFDETNNFFRLLVKRGIDEYKKIASASTLISNMVFKLREKIEQGKLFFNKTIYNNQKSII
jgi:DNA repair exonuclease SbcCD ATPase subunit